jgi:hypothetical protein
MKPPRRNRSPGCQRRGASSHPATPNIFSWRPARCAPSRLGRLCLNAKPDRCFAASALGEDFHLGRGDPTFTPGLKIGRSSFIVLPGHSAPGRVLMVSRGLCQTGETEAVEASLWRDSRDRLTPTALRPSIWAAFKGGPAGPAAFDPRTCGLPLVICRRLDGHLTTAPERGGADVGKRPVHVVPLDARVPGS